MQREKAVMGLVKRRLEHPKIKRRLCEDNDEVTPETCTLYLKFFPANSF